MNGNQNLSDPSEMFKSWIQKNGRAQAEFMKNFGSLMANQTSQTVNPLEILKGVSDSTKQIQSNVTALATQGHGFDSQAMHELIKCKR